MDVTSFGIDHDVLLRGVYVSRVDEVGGDFVTTFDVRMKEPNREPVIDTAIMHTLEHLIAIYYRGNKEWADKTIYVGPMGCRTGMYFVFKGKLTPSDVLSSITSSYEYVLNFSGEIPAAKANMCGNYLDHNLPMSQYESKKFLNEVLYGIQPENLEYPKINYS
ncbi:S-ribosylhomocysteine lyase [Clostridia bacterium]|nr:S-ribosylhomocysteine lyase [Clostridia bacterium]GHU76857.1 S-ribosylhomocysteine lyase [Clostridia bacterium]